MHHQREDSWPLRNGERLMAENVKMEYDLVFEDEQGRSFIARVFRKIFEAFIPKGSDPGTIFLRDLRRISLSSILFAS